LLVKKFISKANSIKDTKKRVYITATPLSKKILKNISFIFKANSIKDTKKRVYITATPLSKKILKNISFIFKYY